MRHPSLYSPSRPEPPDDPPDDLDTSVTEDGWDTEVDRISGFLRDRAAAADATGIVVTLGGGLDSTVTAALAVEALGADRVYGLIMPCMKHEGTAHDAEAIAEALGIAFDTVHLHPLYTQFVGHTPDRVSLHGDAVTANTLAARLRATMAWLVGTETGRLVVGTANRSERLLGCSRTHDDSVADVLPIGHLFRTQVDKIAEALDVPAFVRTDDATPGVLPAYVDSNDLDAPYETIDRVLALAVDDDVDEATIADRLDVDPSLVAAVCTRCHESASSLDSAATRRRS